MKTSTTQASVRRALRIIKALKGQALTGLSNSELAQHLQESPVNITRATQVLVDEGMLIKLESGRYALSSQLLHIAQLHAIEMQTAQDRLNEMQQRLMAGVMTR